MFWFSDSDFFPWLRNFALIQSWDATSGASSQLLWNCVILSRWFLIESCFELTIYFRTNTVRWPYRRQICQRWILHAVPLLPWGLNKVQWIKIPLQCHTIQWTPSIPSCLPMTLLKPHFPLIRARIIRTIQVLQDLQSFHQPLIFSLTTTTLPCHR